MSRMKEVAAIIDEEEPRRKRDFAICCADGLTLKLCRTDGPRGLNPLRDDLEIIEVRKPKSKDRRPK